MRSGGLPGLLGLVRRPGPAVLAGYLAVSFLYFGARVLVEGGSQYIGPSESQDPAIFIWSLGWWPHAILHGENPFVTHAVWAPVATNLTWVTSVPGLALLFAPLTVTLGPIAAYNAAGIVLPALAAWTAFLLCRRLTRKTWPSLVGGYLFGFSSYVMEHASFGHLNLTSVFLVPLVPLLALKFVDGTIRGRRFLAELSLVLALQLLFSTEISLTLALVSAFALGLGFLFFRDRRRRLRRLLLHVLGAYAIAGALTSPFLYFLIWGYSAGGGFGASNTFVADLLNFVVPTNFSLVGRGQATALAKGFPALFTGQEAYLGAPTVLIVGLFAWGRRRQVVGRFLIACLAVAVVIALGPFANVSGDRLVSLPWRLVSGIPLFAGVETVRLAAFVSLIAGTATALWMAAEPSRTLRIGLPILAVLAIVPNPGEHWSTTYHMPQFVTNPAYHSCLDPNEIVLALPIEATAMIWQAEGGFRFRIAGGYLGRGIPASYASPASVYYVSTGHHLDVGQVGIARDFVAAKHVTSAVVEIGETDLFTHALNRLAAPHYVGGVVLYHFTSTPPSCADAG
jgi:hypothetical protein